MQFGRNLKNDGDGGIPPSPLHISDTAAEKGFDRGTHRLISPSETLNKIKPYLLEMGITRVANITGLDRIGVPVFAVYRPNARSIAVSQGKGLTETAARVSGIMEAIESFHAEHLQLPLILASADEMAQTRLIADTDALPRLSVSNFSVDKPLLWCEGDDMLSDRETWVPYEMVHTNYTRPLPTGSGNFLMSSNGLASGNHRLEAINHGICELVERDALALWSLQGGTANPVGRMDLCSLRDPDCRDVLEKLQRAEMTVAVWDISTDIGIASFVCCLVDKQSNHLGQFYSSHGSGTHPSRNIALLRALTEAAQTRLTYIAGARDDAHRDMFDLSRNPDRIAQVNRDLAETAKGPLRQFENTPDYSGQSLDDDLSHLLQQLKAVSIKQTIAIDLQSRIPDMAFVRVIIPGLEGLHDAPGYIPGRRAQEILKSKTV
ncbi:YcaO-like family protein [Aestuariispira ectoiniformans]|uniref:YcaO-like family protein n=1 Tax=Aestuariispira ectoiniformans TaxID=2775080 RepID=UPI00223BEC38|nr:YcaO-like family protein [Aestuariispira ectoiniformans]